MHIDASSAAPPSPAPPAPAPGGRWTLAALAPLLLLCVCFQDALRGQSAIDGARFLPYDDDLYSATGPLRELNFDQSTELMSQPWDTWILQTLRAGRLPLWQPWNGLGAPLLGNGQSAPFNPLKWLLAGGATGLRETLFLLARPALAALGTCLLAARLGLSPWAGCLAATAFMLNGFFLHHLRFPSLHVFCFLPWLLCVGEELLRRPGMRALASLGLAIGVTGVLGAAEPALFCALAACAIVGGMTQSRASGRARGWGLLGLAVGLGALVAAIEVLPLLDLATVSESYVFGRKPATATPAEPLLLALSHLLSPVGAGLEYNAFVGLVPLALAPLGLLNTEVRRRASVLISIGIILYVTCPPHNLVPAPPLAPNSRYATPLIVLGLILLGAAGLDRLAAGGGRGVATRWLGLGLVVAEFAALGYEACGGSGLGSLWELALVAGLLAGVLLLHGRRAWPARRLAAVLIGLAALDMALATRTLVKPMQPFDYPDTPVLTYLKTRTNTPFRVVGGWGALLPNTNLMHRIASLEQVEAFHLTRYQEFIDAVNDGKISPWPAIRVVGRDFDPNLCDLANVRYFIVSRIGRGVRLGEGLRRDPGCYPVVLADDRVTVHLNRTCLPRARVVYAADFVPLGSAEAVGRLKAQSRRWRTRALVETVDGRPPAGWVDGEEAPTEAAVIEDGDRVTVDARLERSGWLVLADAFHPGWQVAVDGAPAAIHPVNVAFRGVLLSAGAHRVEFRYRPWSVELGLWVSGVGLGLCLLGIAAGRKIGTVTVFRPRAAEKR
ncbi:MAG: YfhO family protein [Planctomycetes bacterium]|nr:YfhO family protein [Planctomycetota bacterium]